MKDIEILYEFPVILTKDKDWRVKQVAKSGAIIILPEDAVLVALPINVEDPTPTKEREEQ